MIAQSQRISPPTPGDSKLVDFASLVQNNLTALFQAAHTHVGGHGVLTSAPLSTDGNVGDVMIGQVSGSVYLYVKVTRTQWYRFGPATAV